MLFHLDLNKNLFPVISCTLVILQMEVPLVHQLSAAIPEKNLIHVNDDAYQDPGSNSICW